MSGVSEAAKRLPAPFNEVQVPEGLRWKYEAVSIGCDRLEHYWSLTGDQGAIHIRANLSEWQGQHEWLGGIEYHYATPPEYMSADKPPHDHCWLLGKPCWHDGTSLGFSERVAPMLPHPYEPWKAHVMESWHHGYVTGVLREAYRRLVADLAGESA